MSHKQSRIILIDPDTEARDVLSRRLRAQDYVVDCAADGVTGAELALAAPPAAVVSDLWMSGVSGVQLCRLLRSEPATVDVPVVLRAERDDPRSRFWAQCAGAAAFVARERVGELMRVLGRVASPPVDDFFMRFGGGANDVRDRIARQLDEALFESVLAAETRALAGACSFPRLFDSLSQLVAQLVSYSLLAVSVVSPLNLAYHAHPSSAAAAEDLARRFLRVGSAVCLSAIHDGDASPIREGQPAPIVKEIRFQGSVVARIMLVPAAEEPSSDQVLSLIARELGGPIRMAALLEASRRLATTDPLTQLANRRAFTEAAEAEIARADRCDEPLSLLLIDIDHFKQVNDKRGHACGDAVLAKIGEVLTANTRPYDLAARWGGEEFVVAMPNVKTADALALGERLRTAIERVEIMNPTDGEIFHVTASLGLTTREDSEPLEVLLERADRGMYQAKSSGRNALRVVNGAQGGVVRSRANLATPGADATVQPREDAA